MIKKPQQTTQKKQLLQASHESRARSSPFSIAAAVPLEEDKDEKTQGEVKESSSSAAVALERRYGSLRPAAVGLLAKVRRASIPVSFYSMSAHDSPNCRAS